MQEIQIAAPDADQRLDRFLQRMLPAAPKSFLYKMLRKKNITLNSRKAEGNERLSAGDSLQLFFSEETLQKFGFVSETPADSAHKAAAEQAVLFLRPEQIVCETEQILIINKPAGVLSQKADPGDVSMVEMIRYYLTEKGELTEASGRRYMPGVVNRLDRNTSGLLIAAKTLPAARELSACLKERTLEKYYTALVRGRLGESSFTEAWLSKDENTRTVSVSRTPVPDGALIRTGWKPLETGRDWTELEVHLLTGKTHQIRAHLAFIGHPLAGDVKYGDRIWNEELKRRTGLKRPFLHACRLEFPDTLACAPELCGRSIEAELPSDLDGALRILEKDRGRNGRQTDPRG